MNDREVAGSSDREVVGSAKVVGSVDKFNNLSVFHSQTVGFEGVPQKNQIHGSREYSLVT